MTLAVPANCVYIDQGDNCQCKFCHRKRPKTRKGDCNRRSMCRGQPPHRHDGCLVGDELEELLASRKLAWLIQDVEACECEWVRKRMNALGCSGCEAQFDTVVQWIQDSAANATLTVPMPRWLKRVGLSRLVREAIRRADEKRQHSQQEE